MLHNRVVLTDDLESQGAWTGDFGTGSGVWQLIQVEQPP